MRCCDVEALWEEMREGVEPPRREHVLVHLRLCTTCQELYRQYEGVAYCLSCLPIVEPPPDLVPRILDHIRDMRQDRAKEPRRDAKDVKRAPAAEPDGLTRLPSPLGTLYVAFRTSGITFVGIDRGDPEDDVRALIERRLRRPVRVAHPPGWVIGAIKGFFTTWSADLERVDISDLTEFERAALQKAAQIPPGEVRSYGWIAREIGRPHAARAVGQVMARNPVALLFPCHRVVDARGEIHQYGYGVEVKARILSMEGYPMSAREQTELVIAASARSAGDETGGG